MAISETNLGLGLGLGCHCCQMSLPRKLLVAMTVVGLLNIVFEEVVVNLYLAVILSHQMFLFVIYWRGFAWLDPLPDGPNYTYKMIRAR